MFFGFHACGFWLGCRFWFGGERVISKEFLLMGSVLPLGASVMFDVAMSLLFWCGEGVVGWLVCSGVMFFCGFYLYSHLIL